MERLPGSSEKEEKERRKAEYIAVAKELSERNEQFAFPGIREESYREIRASLEEYPEYSTPIDELVERFQAEGMKVVLGKDPESGNVYILPQGSDNIEMDSLFPRHLLYTADMDADLKKLIELNLQR